MVTSDELFDLFTLSDVNCLVSLFHMVAEVIVQIDQWLNLSDVQLTHLFHALVDSVQIALSELLLLESHRQLLSFLCYVETQGKVSLMPNFFENSI